MKFVLAAGILAQTLPQLDAVDSKGLHSNGHQRLRRISPVSGNSILRQEVSSKRLENIVFQKDWFTQRRKKNVLKNAESSFDECVPNADDADIGILGCSMGEHCVESAASNLGGVCVADDSSSRHLQTTLPPDVCDPNAELPYTCNCTQFNVTTNTGKFSCDVDDYFCFLPGYCGALKIDRTIEAGVESSHYCITFSKPSVAQICYTVDTVPSCAIAVNGVTCNSCEVVDILDDGIRGCYDWDCGNIFPNSTGNDCQGGFILSDVFPNALPNAPDVFVCDICGDGGMITKPDIALQIPNLVPPLTCGQVDAAAKNGSVLEPQCPLLQPFVQQSCGCVPPVVTTPSTVPSVVPSIPAQTVSPSAPLTNVTIPPTLAPVATPAPVAANVTSPPTLAPVAIATVPPTLAPVAANVTSPPTLPPVNTIPPTTPSPAPVVTTPPISSPVVTVPPVAPTLPPVSTLPPISLSMSMSMSMDMRVRELGGVRDLPLPELEEVLESEFGRFL